MKKEMTCIVCPMGCQLQLDIDDATLKLSVSGNNCPRGIKYAHEELTNPKRTLTTTVLLERAELTRLPVVTDGPIPKGKLMEAMQVLNCLRVKAPVHVNDILVKNICQSGVNVIASRTVTRISNK